MGGPSSRKNKIQIIDQVLEQISKKELTVNEIAEKIGSHWLTVRDTINFLLKHGLVEDIQTEGDKKYRISKNIVQENLTYYNVPVDKKTKNLAFYLFKNIKERWFEVRNSTINKTFLQKIAVDVIEKQQLSIPCGRYKFGKITLFNVEPSYEYEVTYMPKNHKKISEEVRKSVDIFKKFKKTWEIRDYQYKEHKNLQYLICHNLELIGKNMVNLSSEHNKKALPTQLNNLKNQIPENEDTKEIKMILLDFISVINSHIATNTNINQIKYWISRAYESIWDLIATYNFYTSLSEYEAYDKNTLKSYFYPRMEEKISHAKDRIAELEIVC